jgi:hypothetical protein
VSPSNDDISLRAFFRGRTAGSARGPPAPALSPLRGRLEKIVRLKIVAIGATDKVEVPLMRRSSPSPSPPASLLAVAGFVILALVAPLTARADGKGKIFVSDTEFGAGYGSDAAMMKAVHKQSKPSIKGDAGNWTLNLMVFLKEAAGATSINIVYYDVSVKPRDQVNFSEVKVQSSQKIVPLNGVALSKDVGFVKGHKYDIVATRIIGKKEKIYATGTVTLK